MKFHFEIHSLSETINSRMVRNSVKSTPLLARRKVAIIVYRVSPRTRFVFVSDNRGRTSGGQRFRKWRSAIDFSIRFSIHRVKQHVILFLTWSTFLTFFTRIYKHDTRILIKNFSQRHTKTIQIAIQIIEIKISQEIS